MSTTPIPVASGRDELVRESDADAIDPRTLPPVDVSADRRGVTRRLSRVANLLRYHRPSQFARRLASRLRGRWLGWRRGGRFASRPIDVPALRRGFDPTAIVERRAADCRARSGPGALERFRRGTVRLLNEERPIDGSHDDVSRLWRFRLESHDWLQDVHSSAGALGDDAGVGSVWRTVRDWITASPLSSTRRRLDGWHPFCVSKRLSAWISMWWTAPPPEDQRASIASSILQQARFLEAHLERDLGGNHLLENLRALLLCGVFFEGREAERLLDEASRRFEVELETQFTSHGEHFERSPMYHALMLEVVLDVRDATAALRPEFSARCDDVAGRASRFLRAIAHPDGAIPLFSDSALGESAPIRTTAGDADTANGFHGPYWTWRDGDDFLVFDAGPVAADHLPAHGHADLLGFEMSIGGRRCFVDSGVFDYGDGAMRRYCRSVVAHNALQVDDHEPCDVWSRFRMGARGRVIDRASGVSGGFEWAVASHDGYRGVGVPRVRRWVAGRQRGPWFVVDHAEGGGPRTLTSRLHLHPMCVVRQDSDNGITLRVGDRLVAVWAINACVRLRRGWYCPEFGQRESNVVLEAVAEVAAPAAVGWCISDSGAAVSNLRFGDVNRERLEIVWANRGGPETLVVEERGAKS